MNNFYSGDAVRPRYDTLIEAYQIAFAGPPWNEVSKCADQLQRCVDGLSQLAVGEWCKTCDKRPIAPAYEDYELSDRFDYLAESRDAKWYIEENQNGLTLAAVAWRAKVDVIAAEKYAGSTQMAEWLTAQFGDQEFVWLDEVFANKANRLSGNLANFGAMCTGFSQRLGSQTLSYRTITPQMLRAAKRDFGVKPLDGVPDRRSLIAIALGDIR